VSSVRKTIEQLPQDVRVAVGTAGESLEESVVRLAIPKRRVLVVFANPKDTTDLRLSQEDRAIRQAIERGKARDCVSLEVRHATTVDDLRRALLDDGYEVFHFSGHGDFDSLLFEDEQGKALDSPLKAIQALIERNSSVRLSV
jgi:hypothetical protein